MEPRPAAGPEGAEGPDAAPAWGAPIRSTLVFLLPLAILGVGILGFGLRLPGWVLYGTAAVFAVGLTTRVFADPELLVAVFILYVPFSKMFVVPMLPGLNATNGLEALLLLAWAIQAGRAERPAGAPMPFARLVTWWGVLSVLSMVTATFTFGSGFVLDHASDVKQWLDQFIVFFAFLYVIRDGAMARRVVVYMMIGAAIVLALGVQEWLDKRWLDSIDKARLLGPQLQPNDYGAFLVYIAGPFLGVLLVQLARARAWLLVPYFLVLAKVLLATFSRGAFVGMALAGAAAGWVRGKTFVLLVALLAGALLASAPELVPESLSARMSSTRSEGEELDASSQTRIVLWNAAVAMTLESPLLGKGFKSFPRLKALYTEMDVEEADNHNMFLYVASQMGLPALAVLLWLLWRTYRAGARLHRDAPDPFGRAVGMGASAMAAGIVGVNMFGSRMVDIAVTGYFWIYLAALAHLTREVEARASPSLEAPRDGAERT